jgi:hypothetical protein
MKVAEREEALSKIRSESRCTVILISLKCGALGQFTTPVDTA